MGHLSVLLLSVLAFACLALAMERHQEDLFAGRLGPGATNGLRAAGWALLCGSLALALGRPSWAIGLVAWFGCLSAGAGMIFMALMLAVRIPMTRRPQRR